MDTKLEEFTKNHGLNAARAALESYKKENPTFDPVCRAPMMFASGYTASRLAKAISDEWISPLKRQARIAGLSAMLALVLLCFAMFYVWSLVSFTSFATFLAAFSPAAAAILFSAAKSYKAWAEARKHLAEAKGACLNFCVQGAERLIPVGQVGIDSTQRL